eukprot:jgi/Ulvmu1/6925/UM032_0003.1
MPEVVSCSSYSNAALSRPRWRRGTPRLRQGVASGGQRSACRWTSLDSRRKLRAVAGGSSFDEFDVAKLPFSARQAVMQALDSLGRSATAAEVASRAGLSIQETQRCLQGLASESEGNMKVTSAGDIIYVFPENYRARLLQRSAALRSEEAARAAFAVLMRTARVAFGVALIGSIVFAAVALTAISSSSSSNDNNRGPGFALWVDPFDVWYLTDASARRRRVRERERRRGGKKEENGVLKFLEDAFRVVFGGPDPNAGLEEAQWQAVGERIVARGGVVAAEELRPLLDVDTRDPSDEAYMLPVLLRLNGSVQVSSEGDMLYAFPELQRRAAQGGAQRGLRGAFRAAVSWIGEQTEGQGAAAQPYISQQGAQEYLEEKRQPVFDVRPGSAAPLAIFVFINGLLVSSLASVVADPTVMQGLQSSSPEFAGLLTLVTPLLGAYASLYIVGPLLRFAASLRGNARAAQANAVRQQAAAELEAPSPELREKMRRARAQHRLIDVTREAMVFDTAEERAPEAAEVDEWDARFSRSRRGRSR